MSYTSNGNVRGPGYVLMLKWIAKGWLNLTTEFISETFRYCGITTSEINRYHINLIRLLREKEILPNTTVDLI